jgi:cytoskeleton protein RodZ
MESIGAKLRSIREEKGITLDIVSRETNISRHYLVSLEEDRFDGFPGESYLLGFLRNYSEFLGEDPAHYISLYKNIKIQEEPIPEGLLKDKFVFPTVPVLIGLGVFALGLGIFFFGGNISEAFTSFAASINTEGTNPDKQEYPLAADFDLFRQRVKTDDSIIIPVGNLELTFVIGNIGAQVEINSELGSASLVTQEEKIYDLDGDGQDDLRIFLDDVPDREFGVTVVFERLESPPTQPDTPTEGVVADNTATAPGQVDLSILPETPAESPGITPVNTGSTTAVQVPGSAVVLTQSAVKQPFTLEVVFLGSVLFRSEIDGGSRQESFYQNGETLRLVATDNIVLGSSDAGAVSVKVEGIDLSLGQGGDIAVHQIRWVNDSPEGPFRLQSFPLN